MSDGWDDTEGGMTRHTRVQRSYTSIVAFVAQAYCEYCR
jgi:hypothetical protein